jgi:endonuclease YncB( thermonuclease family)
VPAIVLSVTDGDTARVRAYPWLPGFSIETAVRISGIDTPELKSHADCIGEAEQGDRAKRFATAAFAGQVVSLIGVEEDKYGGRVIASVTRASDGADWSTLLLASGLARPYTGVGPRPTWCPQP